MESSSDGSKVILVVECVECVCDEMLLQKRVHDNMYKCVYKARWRLAMYPGPSHEKGVRESGMYCLRMRGFYGISVFPGLTCSLLTVEVITYTNLLSELFILPRPDDSVKRVMAISHKTWDSFTHARIVYTRPSPIS